MPSNPVLHFYQVPSKYSKGFSSYRADRKPISNKKQREITPKVRKPWLSFLYATHRLVLFTFLPSIIKIFQRVVNLQSGHEINA